MIWTDANVTAGGTRDHGDGTGTEEPAAAEQQAGGCWPGVEECAGGVGDDGVGGFGGYRQCLERTEATFQHHECRHGSIDSLENKDTASGFLFSNKFQKMVLGGSDRIPQLSSEDMQAYRYTQ